MKDIHARCPIDKTAALVTSPGVHYEPDLSATGRADSELPIQTTQVPFRARDLTGLKFGRFTVIGFHSKKKNSTGGVKFQRWVVKCACGIYSVRRGNAILSNKDPNESCDRCFHLRTVQFRAGIRK